MGQICWRLTEIAVVIVLLFVGSGLIRYGVGPKEKTDHGLSTVFIAKPGYAIDFPKSSLVYRVCKKLKKVLNNFEYVFEDTILYLEKYKTGSKTDLHLTHGIQRMKQDVMFVEKGKRFIVKKVIDVIMWRTESFPVNGSWSNDYTIKIKSYNPIVHFHAFKVVTKLSVAYSFKEVITATSIKSAKVKACNQAINIKIFFPKGVLNKVVVSREIEFGRMCQKITEVTFDYKDEPPIEEI